jgi:hypothetical protein
VPVEADRALREFVHPWSDSGPQRVSAHAVDHDKQDIEHGRTRLAPQGSQRVVQNAVRRPAECGDETLLARPVPIHEAESCQ